jgi:hypothetical protein
MQHHSTKFLLKTPAYPSSLCAGEAIASPQALAMKLEGRESTTPSPLPSPLILTGQCPRCGNALVTRSPHDQTRFIGCSGFPACTYRGDYDATLHQLRDRLARAEAEVELLRRQAKPVPALDMTHCHVIDQKLRRLGEVVARGRYEAPAFAAELLIEILAIRAAVERGTEVVR